MGITDNGVNFDACFPHSKVHSGHLHIPPALIFRVTVPRLTLNCSSVNAVSASPLVAFFHLHERPCKKGSYQSCPPGFVTFAAR